MSDFACGANFLSHLQKCCFYHLWPSLTNAKCFWFCEICNFSCKEFIASSDVTIRLYKFRSISIGFFDQLFDLDSIQFDFFMICTPLLTLLDSWVAAWERQCCSAGHPRSYPPPLPPPSAWTGKMLSGQRTDQTVWHCDTELKLPSWTARRHTLTLSIVWCSV